MSETIQEYLVALGFNLDEHSWRKFSEGTSRATVLVQNLGIGAAAAAAAVSVAVEQIAHRYEDLYYASQRTGESVKGLLSFEYAARQIGLTAGQARGAVEGFAMSLRMSPGLQGLLKQYGVSATQPVEQMQQLVANLKQVMHMPYYTAARVGGMFGIDEHTFVQMWNNVERMTEAGNRYRGMLQNAGLDSQKVSEDSVRLGRAMGALGASFDILGTKILHGLIEPFEKVVSGVGGTIERLTSADPQATIAAQEAANPYMGKTGSQSALARKYPWLRSYLGLENPASIRSNNPGAMWPGPSAARFGASSYIDLGDGQGNKMAVFGSPEAGGAAQFDLLDRKYAGMSLAAAVQKWSGGNNAMSYTSALASKLGMDPSAQITHEMLRGSQGVELAKAMARHEAGRSFPMSDTQWQAAQQWAFTGQKPESVVNNINITVNGKADPHEVATSVKEGLNFIQRRQFIRHGAGVR
jgi:hypothetical protein